MTTYNTGNPVPSADARDRYDNSQTLDEVVNGESASYTTRTGKQVISLGGMNSRFNNAQYARESAFNLSQEEKQEAFQAFLDGTNWSSLGPYGAGVVITSHTQTVDYLGQPYSLKPSIPASLDAPYVTTGVWATEGVNFKLVGDNSLRQDLTGSGGALIIGDNVVSVNTIADLLATTHKSDLTYRVTAYHEWSLTTAYLGPLGGGDFKFLEGSTIPADGGVIFEVPGGRVLRICDITSVKAEWYGAVGDGVVNDTAALRLVCRSEVAYDNDYGYTFLKPGGRKITLRPGGNYRITAPIYHRKGDWLEGGGYTSTRIFSNQAGIGQLIYVGWSLVDGILSKDPGGLIPKITDICFAENVGGVNAIFLDGISGWDVRDCWFFADCGVRAVGITNDGFMLNCVADNGSGHLAIFEGTGDGYHTGQSTVIQNCGAFKTRYGGIKLDGVSDVLILGGFLNFVPFYGLYTGTVKKNSRIKAIGVNFKGDIAGAGMDPTQQHVRVTAPTDGFALVNCGFAYSLNADIQANYPVQVSGGYSTKAANDSVVCLGGRSTIKGMHYKDTGRYPVRSTVRIDVDRLIIENPLTTGIPADIFARGAIYLAGSGSKSTAFNCTRDDDKGPVVSTNGISGVRSSGNMGEGTVDVLHYTGTGVNYSINERANNPVGLWRNVELLRDGFTRWIDSSGRQRIKNGDPTSETDGTVVGTQT